MPKIIKRRCPACKKVRRFRDDNKTCGCQGTNPVLEISRPMTPKDLTQVELQKLRDRREGKDDEINALREEVIRLERELSALVSCSQQTPQIIEIPPTQASGKSESAAVMLWSDHHSEELVLRGQSSGMNEHNLEINSQRFTSLVHGNLSWFNIAREKTVIKSITIALLGDFITGNIHADLAEANLLPPTDAIFRVQNQLISGLLYIRDNTPEDVAIKVVCHGGNHGRMTKDQRIATEIGNSLEQYMYYTIRDFFKADPRFEFVIATGYHTFVNYFGTFEVRYHHGHQINYQGGVGGITIPVNKAIAQWNKAHPVKLDCFGHFHTKFDGGNFVANGSQIGYNAYAVSIKASFEEPSQTFFLINREYNEKTMVAPVFVGKK
jgi:hypothetical protein